MEPVLYTDGHYAPVEAMQLAPDTLNDVVEWLGPLVVGVEGGSDTLLVTVQTDFGAIVASTGDWVLHVPTPNGPFWVLKAATFADTYERVVTDA